MLNIVRLAGAILCLWIAAAVSGQSIPPHSSAPASAPVFSSDLTGGNQGPRDEADFVLQVGKLKDSDVDARLTLARWAFNHGMYDQAVNLANDALYRDPGNRAAFLVLQQVDKARPLADEPDTEKALQGRDGRPVQARIQNTKFHAFPGLL